MNLSPSQCFVLIKQSDSLCPHQFQDSCWLWWDKAQWLPRPSMRPPKTLPSTTYPAKGKHAPNKQTNHTEMTQHWKWPKHHSTPFTTTRRRGPPVPANKASIEKDSEPRHQSTTRTRPGPKGPSTSAMKRQHQRRTQTRRPYAGSVSPALNDNASESRPQKNHSALRASPYPKVTDLICRLPLLTLLQYTRGCSPWGPDAVIGTVRSANKSLPLLFKDCRKRTGHPKSRMLFPVLSPYLWVNQFQGIVGNRTNC